MGGDCWVKRREKECVERIGYEDFLEEAHLLFPHACRETYETHNTQRPIDLLTASFLFASCFLPDSACYCQRGLLLEMSSVFCIISSEKENSYSFPSVARKWYVVGYSVGTRGWKAVNADDGVVKGQPRRYIDTKWRVSPIRSLAFLAGIQRDWSPARLSIFFSRLHWVGFFFAS